MLISNKDLDINECVLSSQRWRKISVVKVIHTEHRQMLLQDKKRDETCDLMKSLEQQMQG